MTIVHNKVNFPIMLFLQVKELIAKDEIEIGDILSHSEKTGK